MSACIFEFVSVCTVCILKFLLPIRIQPAGEKEDETHIPTFFCNGLFIYLGTGCLDAQG